MAVQLRPQRSQDFHLFLDALAPHVEVLVEGLVLDGVPANGHAQA